MIAQRKYLRFTISDRIEHWVQMAAFSTLGLTGLIQKFATNSLALRIISLLGGIEFVRLIHRGASVVLMIGVIYHLGSVGYKIFVLHSFPAILPTIDDVRSALNTFLYNLGRKESKPQQGRYTFDEKLEYWAFVWGTILMGVTGFMLWNPIATANLLPGQYIPAAKAAHGAEALLAVLAIIIWHFYNVHFKHLNTSMFTGKLSEKEMLEEHPLELADLKAGVVGIPVEPALVAQRSKVYFPIYSVAAAVMLSGIYFFVSFEKTAITTIPPAEDVEVFVPYTATPLPTPLPSKTPSPDAGKSWNAGMADLFIDRCGDCHGDSALGGLTILSYADAMKGGLTGEVILPGEPDESLLVQRQATGDHPGQFTGEDLVLVREWIEAGAPEE